MKRSITSVLAAATMLVAANVNAGEVYFFSPNGSGEGYSWEDAMSGDDLAATLKEAASGDVFYLLEGTYYNKVDGYWQIPYGVTIKGGFPASSTGTNVDVTYPTGAETIFDADISGDGLGDNGNNAYFTIKGNEGYYTDVDPILLEGITIKNARVGHDTEKVVSDYTGAAMYASNANLELSFVKFDSNVRVGDITKKYNRGSIVIVAGCYTNAHDCVWVNNEAQSSGACISARQRGGGSEEVDVAEHGITILDRCYFAESNRIEDVTSSNNSYAGFVTLADAAGTMIINNCTAHSNPNNPTTYRSGAFARIGGKGCTFYMMNSTIYDFYSSAELRGLLSFATITQSYLANNIVVNTTDEAENDGKSVMWFQEGSSVYTSGGYNVWGSTFDPNSYSSLISTDSYGKANTVATVFGTNTIADGVIAPLETYRTVTTADLVTAATSWGINDKIDVTVDQKGNKRPDTTVPGAYDVKATSGIEDIVAESDAEVIAVEYYNIQGQKLNVAPENGLYIQKAIKADGTVKASKLVK